jgi:Putative MetA-pathway of phenol degradation
MSCSGTLSNRYRSGKHSIKWLSWIKSANLMTGIVLAMAFVSTCFSADNPLLLRNLWQSPLVPPFLDENVNDLSRENSVVAQLIPISKPAAVDPFLQWPWLPRPEKSNSRPFLRLINNTGDIPDPNKGDAPDKKEDSAPEKKDDDKPDKKDDDKSDKKGDDKGDQKTPPEPDISKPGADFGDYPNSAFTLPKGRCYLEIAPISYQGKDRHNSASNSYNYLFRYGVTDDVEFRLTGSGLTTVFDPGTTVVGFAPLIIDTKIHLWDDQMDKLLPAASFEAFLQTNLASPTFQSGYQPSINMNLDFPFTKDTNVEMTFGFTGVQDAVRVISGERFIPRLGHNIPTLSKANLNVNQFSYQWALEQQITEKFQIFFQGYYNGDVFRQSAAGKVVGIGYFYQFDKRGTFFNSYNSGLDPASPNFSSQVGFAFAF